MSDNYQSSTAKCDQQPPLFFPEDIVIQILLRLPVRSLLEFKCVCKSWKTLISDSKFAKTHLQILTLNPGITHQQHIFPSRLMYHPRNKIVSLPLKPLLENPSKSPKPAEFSFCREDKFHIFGSCNGMLCLFDEDQGFAQLWNPTIRFKSKKSLNLDPFDENWYYVYYHGFGYDHINDKYKLLVVVYHEDETSHRSSVTKIYTFGATCWKTIENFPSQGATSRNGKFVSGTLNWVIYGSSSNQEVILSFDIVKETYKEVLLPKHDTKHYSDDEEIGYSTKLGVLGNCICVCFDSNKTHWDFWLMKKYGVVDSWTRLMMIPHELFLNWQNIASHYIEPLFMVENSSVLLTTIEKLFLYNLNNGSLKYISDIDMLYDQYIYYESLVSPQL